MRSIISRDDTERKCQGLAWQWLRPDEQEASSPLAFAAMVNDMSRDAKSCLNNGCDRTSRGLVCLAFAGA